MFDDMSAAWATNDGNSVAGHFTGDGSLINPFGQRADGRTAIAAMYREYFAGMLRGSTTAVKVSAARPVHDDYAFADTEQTICGPNGEVLLSLHMSALLHREGADWRIADARPYGFAPAPA
jgi:uncharacterized protein (TIGR02246 family)